MDRWIRDPDKLDGKPGGGGITCITQDGAIFEKAGDNIVHFVSFCFIMLSVIVRYNRQL